MILIHDKKTNSYVKYYSVLKRLPVNVRLNRFRHSIMQGLKDFHELRKYEIERGLR